MSYSTRTQDRNREAQRRWLAKMTDEERKAFFRTRYQKNKEKYNKQSKQWAKDNPHKMQAAVHQRAIQKKYPEQFAVSEITTPELAVWLKYHRGKPCLYCGQPATHIEHTVPLSLGGRHSWANIDIACETCNYMKSNLTKEDWIAHIKAIIQHLEGV